MNKLSNISRYDAVFLTLLKIHQLRMCPKKPFIRLNLYNHTVTREWLYLFPLPTHSSVSLLSDCTKKTEKNICFCAFGVSVSRR